MKKLILMLFLISSSSQALIAIPDGQCDFEGRWIQTEENKVPVYHFVINEETGGEKRFVISNVKDSILKSIKSDNKVLSLKLKIVNDKLSGDSKAYLVKINGATKSIKPKTYLPKDLDSACKSSKK